VFRIASLATVQDGGIADHGAHGSHDERCGVAHEAAHAAPRVR
jgi:hypothetical protein